MESEEAAAAVKALGPLFKLTEVYIWEDGSTETRPLSSFPDSTASPDEVVVDLCLHPKVDDTDLHIPHLSTDYGETPEDVELTKMNELGLPVSFRSSKETKIKVSKRKGGARSKQCSDGKGTKEKNSEFSKTSVIEIESPPSLNFCTSNSLSCLSMMGGAQLHDYDETVMSSESSEVLGHEGMDSHVQNGDLPDWKVNWDACYRRYFEYLPYDRFGDDPSDIIVEATEMEVSSLTTTITDDGVEDYNMHEEIVDPAADDLCSQDDRTIKKQKKKSRRARIRRKSSWIRQEIEFDEVPVGFPDKVGKYWFQRYLLFSRFDDGVKMDEEGWFSVTPEPIAMHHASRCAGDVVVDCFTGVGGNSIQFAQRCKHVIAIDIDPKKIDYAYHNATIYGVEDQIDFIKGDFFVLAPKLKADTVFLSPPWGGPGYVKVDSYDIKTMLKPHSGYFLFDIAKKVACKVIMFLPRNVDLNQLAELALSTNPPWSLEVEKNYLNERLKAITAYFTNTEVQEC